MQRRSVANVAINVADVTSERNWVFANPPPNCRIVVPAAVVLQSRFLIVFAAGEGEDRVDGRICLGSDIAVSVDCAMVRNGSRVRAGIVCRQVRDSAEMVGERPEDGAGSRGAGDGLVC